MSVDRHDAPFRHSGFPDGTTQIKVKATGWQEWSVRAVIPLPTLRPNGRYLLSFDARAERSRPITVPSALRTGTPA